MSKPTTFMLNAKCDDRCQFVVYDEDGNELQETIDYVPYAMGLGGGDYIHFKIDIETGQILNWKKPDPEDLAAYIAGEEY